MQVVSQAEYARHLFAKYGKKLSRQAIHKDYGKTIPAREDGKVDVAAADAAMILAGRIQLPAEDAPPATPGELPVTAPQPEPKATSDQQTLTARKAEREEIEIEMARMRLAKEKGELIYVADVGQAMAEAGGKIVELLNLIPGWADDIAAALAKDGVPALRVFLRGKVTELRSAVGGALTLAPTEEAGDESA